jgi:hypothetical protein
MNDQTTMTADQLETALAKCYHPSSCRHIFPADGRRCGSPALRDGDFCFYHNPARATPQPRRVAPGDPLTPCADPNLSYVDAALAVIEIPLPVDRAAIHAGIGIILQALARNRLDGARAKCLLHGLQLASQNL